MFKLLRGFPLNSGTVGGKSVRLVIQMLVLFFSPPRSSVRCFRVCCEPILSFTTTRTTSPDCGSTSASGGCYLSLPTPRSLTHPLLHVCTERGEIVSFSCFVDTFRVFSDRLIDYTDLEAFVGLLGKNLASLFDLTFHGICPNKQPPIFGMMLASCRIK